MFSPSSAMFVNPGLVRIVQIAVIRWSLIMSATSGLDDAWQWERRKYFYQVAFWRSYIQLTLRLNLFSTRIGNLACPAANIVFTIWQIMRESVTFEVKQNNGLQHNMFGQRDSRPSANLSCENPGTSTAVPSSVNPGSRFCCPRQMRMELQIQSLMKKASLGVRKPQIT